MRIHLSEHPHDLITAFVIFCRRDYGTIAPGCTCVDVGANIGIFTLYAAFQGAARIYSYEPNGQAYDILRKNISENGLEKAVFSFNLAVSDVDQKSVHMPVGSSPYNQTESDQGRGVTQAVTTITLQRIFESNHIDHVDLLKVDCEGCEYAILKRSSTDLSRVREIRMEYHEGEIDALQRDLEGQGLIQVRRSDFEKSLWLARA